MRSSNPHVVYFYCHGGTVDKKVPYIQVGPLGSKKITPDTIFSEGISWTDPRPLVFINGCRTTALQPEVALHMVTAFVEAAHASGVIGTEITVQDGLARDFGEAFLRYFLNGSSVGEAVRRARLNLLKRGNPLGLAYIPYALASLQLEDIGAE